MTTEQLKARISDTQLALAAYKAEIKHNLELIQSAQTLIEAAKVANKSLYHAAIHAQLEAEFLAKGGSL